MEINLTYRPTCELWPLLPGHWEWRPARHQYKKKQQRPVAVMFQGWHDQARSKATSDRTHSYLTRWSWPHDDRRESTLPGQAKPGPTLIQPDLDWQSGPATRSEVPRMPHPQFFQTRRRSAIQRGIIWKQADCKKKLTLAADWSHSYFSQWSVRNLPNTPQ